MVFQFTNIYYNKDFKTDLAKIFVCKRGNNYYF